MPESGRPQDPRWESDAELQYRTDPVFRQVVDLLTSVVARAELTPREVRRASMLACIHYEIYHHQERYIVRRPVDWPSEVRP